MSQNPGRRGFYGDTEGSESDDGSDGSDGSEGTAGTAPGRSGFYGDDGSDEQDEPDTGGTTSPVQGQTPPDETEQVDTPGDVTDEQEGPDTGGTTSPVQGSPAQGQTPPEETPEETPTESTSQEDGDFYDPTVTQTSPIGGQGRPPTDDGIQGISGSEEAEIRQDVADEYDDVFYNDITLERENLSESELQDLREEEAAQRDVSADQIEFEETPFRVVPDISEAGRQRSAEVDFAEQYSDVSPRDVDVVDISDGQADVNILNEEAQAQVQAQESVEAQEIPTEGNAEVLSEEETQEALEGIDVEGYDSEADSFGQTTDPDYREGDSPDGITDVASEAIGFDIEEAAVTTGETLIDQPIESTVTGFQTIGRGAGIDEETVQAVEQTPSTVINQPIESTVTGFETGIDVADQGIEDLEAELEGGVGPGTAAVPAVVTGTGSASATSTAAAGTAATGAAVATPVAAGVLGVRGIRQRDDVTVPAPETDTGEVPVQEDTTTVEEVEVSENTVQEQSEIDVTDATLEEQPEIEVEEGTLEYTPEIEVDETTVDSGGTTAESGGEIPIETGATVDQPTGGFEDLPREDIEEPEVDETSAFESDIDQREETEGSSFVFPGGEVEPTAIEAYEPELGYDTDLGIGYGSETGSSLLGDTMPEFGVDAEPTLATDVTAVADVGMETEAITPTETIPEMQFEYPSPNEPGFDYSYEYQWGQGGQDRSPRIPRLFDLPEQDSEPVDSQSEMEAMFSFDIDVGSYMDIL